MFRRNPCNFLIIFAIFLLISGCAKSADKETEDAEMRPKEMPSASEAPEEMEQKIVSFDLINYMKDGSKKWELKGDSADILAEVIYLTNISVNTYEEPKSKLTSDEGDYDRKNQIATLYKNVLLTTEDGLELITDSMKWDGINNVVSTPDPVKIKRSDVIANGLGAKAVPEFKRLMLDKNIEVVLLKDAMGGVPLDKIEQSDREQFKATITCDGPLEIDYENNIAIFKNNVKVDDDRGQITSELMKAYLDPESKSILKVEAYDNVKIVRGEDSTYSERAVYTTADQKIVLLGKPKIFIRADEEIEKAERGFKKTEW